MHLIIPITVELGNGSDNLNDGTASWHTRARGYSEPDPPENESIVVNVVASGIETGVYASNPIEGLTAIAEHLEQVVRHLERDQAIGYQRTAHELESDMRGHARRIGRAESLALLDHLAATDKRAKLHKALDDNEVGRVRGPAHVPDDLFGDLMK